MIWGISSCISAPNGVNVYVKSRYEITQLASIDCKSGALMGLAFDHPLGNYAPDSEGFLNAVSGHEPEPLNYGYFIPQARNAGPRPKIQAYFGGAYVLAPQAKTFWLNDGSGQYRATGKSMYGKALKACVDEFVEKNPGIDRKRIYIGGDSNGGFMTMRMILDYPKYFAAAFPVCEALYDNAFSDKALQKIVHLPIWFTHAKNDPIVKPEETVIPTCKRLIAAGAGNVHFTYWGKIEDIHEGFRDAEGKPYEYISHFAWIPVLNDDCRVDYNGQPVVEGGKAAGRLEWLSMQRK